MPEHIQYRSLLVVSDTPVKCVEGKYFAYQPVLKEMEYLLTMFDNIIWLGCEGSKVGVNMEECVNGRISFVIMPATIHTSFSTVKNLCSYPVFLRCILKYRQAAKYVHTRNPSHPAFLATLLALFDNRRMYWHKYAGNWDSANIPITYLLQKKLLRKLVTDKRKVTVNTVDAKISADIIPFDNPCITEAEMQSAKNVSKLFAGKMTLLFVGNLVNAKGILPLLDAMNIIDSSKVEQLIIAGDGPLREMVEGLAATLPVRVQLTGVLSREELNGCYRQSHFLLLPSKTEGFPKVIAEAAAYGCIPVSTAVGSIPRYIKHKQNGWLLEDDMPATIASALTELLASDSAYLQSLSENASALTETFTYERYVSRLKNEIFSFS